MPKKGEPRPAPDITEADVSKLANELGIVDDLELRRLANTLPGLVTSFYELEKQKADRRTAPTEVRRILEFKEAATALTGHLPWARTAIIYCEMRDVVEGKSPEQQVACMNQVDRQVKAEVSGVTAGIERLLERIQKVEVAIKEEREVPGVVAEVRKMSNNYWLAAMCLKYWQTYLEPLKINQLSFTVGLFNLAKVNIGDERVKELLQRARDDARENRDQGH